MADARERKFKQFSHDYRERARVQCLAWAQGRPYHNRIDDECAPDFSCCCPDLFVKDDAERWAQYHREHGQRN